MPRALPPEAGATRARRKMDITIMDTTTNLTDMATLPRMRGMAIPAIVLSQGHMALHEARRDLRVVAMAPQRKIEGTHIGDARRRRDTMVVVDMGTDRPLRCRIV